MVNTSTALLDPHLLQNLMPCSFSVSEMSKGRLQGGRWVESSGFPGPQIMGRGGSPRHPKRETDSKGSQMQGPESLCSAIQSLASCLVFFTCKMGTLEATVVPAFPNESLFWKGCEPGLLPSGSHLFRNVPVLHRRGPGERAMRPEGHKAVM